MFSQHPAKTKGTILLVDDDLLATEVKRGMPMIDHHLCGFAVALRAEKENWPGIGSTTRGDFAR